MEIAKQPPKHISTAGLIGCITDCTTLIPKNHIINPFWNLDLSDRRNSIIERRCTRGVRPWRI